MQDEVLSHLSTAPLLRELPPQILATLSETAELARLAEGEEALNENDPSMLCLVVTGELSVIETHREGVEDAVRVIRPGELVDDLQKLAGQSHRLTINASKSAQVVRIPGSVVRTVSDESVELRRALNRLHRRQLLCRLYPVLGTLDGQFLEELAAMVEWIDLERGEDLTLRRTEGDSLFLVISGRVEIARVDEDGSVVVLGEAGRGETAGEFAFFRGESSSERVRALRDSVLVALSAVEVEQITAKRPQILRHVMRTLLSRMERSAKRRARARVTNIAIVPTSGHVDARAFSMRLEEELSRIGPTLRLSRDVIASRTGDDTIVEAPDDSPELTRLLSWLDAQEMAHRFLILEGELGPSRWNERCVQLSDRVLLLARGGDDPAPADWEKALLRRDDKSDLGTHEIIVLIHPDSSKLPSGTRKWLDARPTVEEWFHLRWNGSADFGRLARTLAGEAVGVVLGGGGARGFAHIGIIRALNEAGIPIDAIGGTSMGSALAAQHALGWNPEKIASANRRVFVELQPHKVYTLPLYSLVANSKAEKCGEWLYGDADIEDLWIPFYCVSTNLTSADMRVHRTGSVKHATLASASIPVFAPPIVEGDQLLVDGAVVNNMPADIMRAMGCGTVIACEVSVETDDDFKCTRMPSPWDSMRRKLMRRAPAARFPSLLEVAMRVSTLGSTRRETELMKEVDLCLRPPINSFSLMDFERLDDIVQCGYEYARVTLKDWRN